MIMKERSEAGTGEMDSSPSVTLNFVKKYQKFIGKYPKSEVVPEAKLKIADIYKNLGIEGLKESTAWGGGDPEEIAEFKKYLTSARNYYNEVIKAAPNTKLSEKASSGIKEIDAALQEPAS